MLTRLSLRYQTSLPFPKERVVEWLSRAGGNLRLNPAWNRTKNVSIETHLVSNAEHTLLEDRVQCIQPSVWLPASWTERQLHRLFSYRHRVLAHDLACISAYPQAPLKILITGSTGLVGSELAAFLRAAGHTVLELSRKKDRDPNTLLEGLDAVFHLAGENIAGRWTASKKARIHDSRVTGTEKLVELLSKLKSPPKSFLCASAVGYYGSQGSSLVTEKSAAGSDFLAKVCEEWETAASQYAAGRVALLRFGVVLSPSGGALSKMLPPFRLGLGGPVGSGDQYMSWISIDDLLYQCYHVLMTSSIKGPVNIVSPKTVTNREFTQILGKTLNRPTFLPLPAFAVNLLFGEMGRATLLASTRAFPAVLEKTQSHFAYPELDQTLHHLLK